MRRMIHGQERVLNGARRSTRRGDEAQLPVGDPSTFPPAGGIDDSALPIFDQAQLGSCTANAGAFLAAWLVWIRLSVVVIFSRLFLYAITRILEGTPLTDDSGCEPANVYRALTDIGICEESAWPYSDRADRYAATPPPEAYASATHKAELWFECPSLEAVKQSLLDGFPVSFGITLYQSFESAEVARTGIVPNPDVTKETLIGGHDMVAVAFADGMKIPGASAPGAIKARNSWGPDWGDGGYCWISYDQWRNGNAVENITLRREALS